MPHPNLSKEFNENIAQTLRDGGVHLGDLAVGDWLMVETANRIYRIQKTGDVQYLIDGHPEYCPKPTKAHITGSTWGGSAIRIDFVGLNMRLEFVPEGTLGSVTTSLIKAIDVYNRDGERREK